MSPFTTQKCSDSVIRFHKTLFSFALIAAASLMAHPTIAQTPLFSFANAPYEATTLFSETSHGDTAIFSTTDGGIFSVEYSIFSTMPDYVLIDGYGVSANSVYLPLNIAFSQYSSTFSVNFAVSSVGAPLAAQFYKDGTQVGSATASGTLQQSGFDEGILSFGSNALFNSVLLSAPSSPAFAVDNIAVDLPTDGLPAVPEASTTVSFGLLLALGLGSMAAVAKRRKAVAP